MFKNILVAIVLAFTLLVTNVAFGHGTGHREPPTSEQIIEKAFQSLETIVERAVLIDGKPLDASWKEIIDRKIYKQTFRHYIVSFKHAVENRTIYILLNTQGTYLDANFNGKFEKV